MKNKKQNHLISFIIPLFNEEQSILKLYEKLIIIINSININYELFFIDDGSNDNSLQIQKNLQKLILK